MSMCMWSHVVVRRYVGCGVCGVADCGGVDVLKIIVKNFEKLSISNILYTYFGRVLT